MTDRPITLPLTEEWAAELLGFERGLHFDAPGLSLSEFSQYNKDRFALVLKGATAAILADRAASTPAGAAEPDGRLHADGYFTWNKGKRPDYIADRGLPCDFYLAAPAAPVGQAEPSKALILAIDAFAQAHSGKSTFAQCVDARRDLYAAIAATPQAARPAAQGALTQPAEPSEGAAPTAPLSRNNHCRNCGEWFATVHTCPVLTALPIPGQDTPIAAQGEKGDSNV